MLAAAAAWLMTLFANEKGLLESWIFKENDLLTTCLNET